MANLTPLGRSKIAKASYQGAALPGTRYFALGKVNKGGTAVLEQTNIGDRDGTEVIQLYVRQRVASRTRPIRELKGFKRVSLPPGASTTVRFTLTPQDLRFWGETGWVVEPGPFDLWVATSSVNGEKLSFELAP